MEHLVEFVLELLFGGAKATPDQRPEMEYTDRFVVRYPRRKTAAVLCVSLLGTLGAFLLWFLSETRRGICSPYLPVLALFFVPYISTRFPSDASLTVKKSRGVRLCSFKRKSNGATFCACAWSSGPTKKAGSLLSITKRASA